MNITFYTGAGISEESGIPTFRGNKDSLWSKYDVDIVASTYGLKHHLQDVLDFHNTARNLIDKCEPNYCHKTIAELEKQHNITVITTNIDNLHERAGSTNVIHLHGNIHQICDINKDDPYYSNKDVNIGDLHPITQQQLRHNTVLFGELLSTDCYSLYNDIVDKSDMLVIIGTSLSVYPSSEIIHYNNNIIYIDPIEPISKYKDKWNIIRKTACKGINDVLELIK